MDELTIRLQLALECSVKELAELKGTCSEKILSELALIVATYEVENLGTESVESVLEKNNNAFNISVDFTKQIFEINNAANNN